MFTGEFWTALLERAVRAGSGAMLSVLIVGDGILNALDADWENVLGVGLGAAVVSSLLSLAGGATKSGGTAGPSLLGAEKLDPAGPP